jgi:hypothetical protein
MLHPILPLRTIFIKNNLLEVTGKFSSVMDKMKTGGPMILYNGSYAAASATFVGHYPYVFCLFCFYIFFWNLVIFLNTWCRRLIPLYIFKIIFDALNGYYHKKNLLDGSLRIISCRIRFRNKKRQ